MSNLRVVPIDVGVFVTSMLRRRAGAAPPSATWERETMRALLDQTSTVGIRRSRIFSRDQI
jgi:hypothetical protein